MKKIITLFTAAMLVAGFASAQTGEDAKDVILGKKKRTEQGKEDPTDVLGKRRSDDDRDARYPSGSREAEIDRINREYDYKIQTIRNNNALSAEEKRRMIDYLNQEREKELKKVRKDDRRYDEEDSDDRYKKNKKDKEYKTNKGKHKGWEKGNGNKHRNRDNG